MIRTPLGIAENTISLTSRHTAAGIPSIISPTAPLIATITDGNFYEIVELHTNNTTLGVGNNYTAVRATEGTSARAWAAGTELSLRITAEVLRHAATGTIEDTTIKELARPFQTKVSKHVIPVPATGIAGVQVNVGEWLHGYIAKSVTAFIIVDGSVGGTYVIDMPTITVTSATGTPIATLPAVTGAAALPAATNVASFVTNPAVTTANTRFIAKYPTVQIDVLVTGVLAEIPAITISTPPAQYAMVNLVPVIQAFAQDIVVLVEFVPIQ